MKKIILFIITLILLSCESMQNPETIQTEETQKLLTEINNTIGMPNITNFQQKKLMKLIYEQTDKENLICYAYLVNLNGKLIFIGKTIGYGVPFSAQYTNPQKIQNLGFEDGGGRVTIPQADPNGLYMPTSSSATWLLMLDKKNKPRVVYIEPEIIVSPFKLH